MMMPETWFLNITASGVRAWSGLNSGPGLIPATKKPSGIPGLFRISTMTSG